MADRNDEEILRAILEKGSDKAKKAAADALAAHPPTPAEPPAVKAEKQKRRRKGLAKNKVAGSLGKTKYYFGPGGIIIDKEGIPAPEKIQDMLAKRSEMVEKVKENLAPKYAQPLQKQLDNVMNGTQKLLKTNDMIFKKIDPAFQEVDKSIRKLAEQHELVVRNILKQNQDQQDKLIEELTGQKAATRSAGAKPRPAALKKGAAKPPVGGSRAAAKTPVQAAYQKARFAKPKELQERVDRMRTARRERTLSALKAGGYTGVALGGLGVAALNRALSPSPSGVPRSESPAGPTGNQPSPPGVPGPGGLVTLQTPISKKAYQVAADVAPNFKAFVDELENSGYQIKAIGGYRESAMWHGKGYAIDINPDDNPMFVNQNGRIVNKLTGQESSQYKDTSGRYPFGYGKDNLPQNISQIAAKYGLGWGGNWRSSVDTMHFSAGPNEGGNIAGVTLPPQGSPEQTQTAAAPQPSAVPGVPSEAMRPTGGGYAPPAGGGRGEWKNDTEFMAEVDRLSKKYNVRADDMLALMASESGINPQAGAPGRAVGLIQFMPNIAKSLGTSDVELLGMNRAQQMKYVEKFYDSVGLPSGATAGMMYAYTFLPGRAKNPSGVLTVAGESYYNSNRGLDLDGDGRITVADLDARIAKKAAEYGLGTGAPTAVAQAPAGTTPAAAAAGVPGVPEQAMQPSPGTPNAPAQGAPTGGAPSGDIVAVGRWLEGQGIRVSEHPAFGGVQPVHRGRGHYEGRALDVNAGAGIVEANDPVWGPKFDEIARQAKAAGYNVIWRSAGHYNHMHIEIPSGGPTQVAQGGTMPQAAPPPPTAPHMQPQRGVGFNMAPQLAARSAEVNIFDAISQQMQMALGGGPIIINNTRTINNTRRMIAGNSNIGPRQSEGFDPLQTFGALAAGFAIGKGLRLF